MWTISDKWHVLNFNDFFPSNNIKNGLILLSPPNLAGQAVINVRVGESRFMVSPPGNLGLVVRWENSMQPP